LRSLLVPSDATVTLVDNGKVQTKIRVSPSSTGVGDLELALGLVLVGFQQIARVVGQAPYSGYSTLSDRHTARDFRTNWTANRY
jgi:hypothetical protein